MSWQSSSNLADYVSSDEMRSLLERSNPLAVWMTVFNLAVILAAFALTGFWPNPFTVALALLLLGGRQLGLAVLQHECAHHSFFKTKRLNDLVGTWLFSGLVNASLQRYRAYHLKHHRHAGTKKDPDLDMANAYPAAPDSIRRKLIRDLTGRTGLKYWRRQFAPFSLGHHAPFLASHGALLGLLAAVGIAWTYLLWWGANLVVFQLVSRLRFMSEHGVAQDRLSADVRENTATTLVSWWERLFIGPNFVNYHLEHHLQAGVPCYRLRRFHKLLKQRGYFGQAPDFGGCLSSGYIQVLRKATA